MGNVFVRIDDRLIHGQVVESWIPYLKADQVMVVSDGVAQDAMQQALMRLALSEHIRLSVLRAEQAAACIREAASRPGQILVLTPGPQEVLSILDGGASVSVVNVGGMHYVAGRIHLGRVIYLSEEEKRAFMEIVDRGVRLEGQAVPSEAKMDIAELLRSNGSSQ